MFVVDLIAASVLALTMTIGFAAVVQSRKDGRAGELSPSLWLLSLASWIAGLLVVAFGPALTGTHWLPFAVTGFVLGLLVLVFGKIPELQHSGHASARKPKSEVNPVIAMYFITTILLFFCGVSLRFYLVNLS